GPESVDTVTFSYSLTMIPDWFAAVEQAFKMLRPGGTIAVVDFFVSRKFGPHGWWTRTFWPTWFCIDNVYLNPDHPEYLGRRFTPVRFEACHARVPYVPLGKVPYYLFVGKK